MKTTIQNIFVSEKRLQKKALKKNEKELSLWHKQGCPVPPPHIVKQLAISEYRERYACSVFVETGTFRGDMVEAQKMNFSELYSVELSKEYYDKAVERFVNDSHVNVVFGDSGSVLPFIVEKLSKKTLFWLDGHYSGGKTAKGETECPIFSELEAIFSQNTLEHIILIDDARCFNGEGDYPTIAELQSFISKKNNRYTSEIKDDIIRFVVSD